jgi:predicted acyltransferase
LGNSLVSHFVSRSLASRNLALDGLRGLMILGMILVNHSPSGAPAFAPLTHAAWHGWSLADTIFPGFLFTVGVSIRLAMVGVDGKRLVPTGTLYLKVLRRVALLLLLNFLLLNFPYYELGKLYFTGTLARIGWCYLIIAMVHLNSGWRAQLALLCFALASQWASYALIPVPGVGGGSLTPQANAGLYLDQLILTPLFGISGPDADGYSTLLPTLGAVTTTLIGLLTGHWLCAQRALNEKVNGMLVAGLALTILGLVGDAALPVNKPLWTATYTVLMAGISLLILAAFYWIGEIQPFGAWLTPLKIAGVNALFFFVFAQSIQRLLVYGRLPTDGGNSVRLGKLIHEEYFSGWPVAEVGSLCYSLIFLAICYGVVFALYRRRLFIRL